MKTLYTCILENLKQGQPLVEVTIIEQQGSAPRTAGAKMIVVQDTSARGVGIHGTVGGGIYEAKAIDLAQTFFAQNSNKSSSEPCYASIVYFDLRGNKLPTDMDMICGGELRLLVEYIPVAQDTIALYEALVQAETLGQACTLITRVKAESNLENKAALYNVCTDKTLLFPEESNSIDLNTQILPSAIQAYLRKCVNKKTGNLILDDYEYIFENLHKPYAIHIFGAGHVSYELARITHYLGFKTIVLDDRAEFSNRDRFPNAVSLVLSSLDKVCVNDYFSDNKPNAQDGIIIVTRGHARDRDVLAASLETEAGYIGMIGSKSKRQATYDFLLNNGYNKEDFAKIHSPIGLSIGAQTPQEIAISITAQLIQWRSGHIQLGNTYV